LLCERSLLRERSPLRERTMTCQRWHDSCADQADQGESHDATVECSSRHGGAIYVPESANVNDCSVERTETQTS